MKFFFEIFIIFEKKTLTEKIGFHGRFVGFRVTTLSEPVRWGVTMICSSDSVTSAGNRATEIRPISTNHRPMSGYSRRVFSTWRSDSRKSIQNVVNSSSNEVLVVYLHFLHSRNTLECCHTLKTCKIWYPDIRLQVYGKSLEIPVDSVTKMLKIWKITISCFQ